MRSVKRLLILVLPWLLFVSGIGIVFKPQSGAQWLLAGHWLLIPFLPVYVLLVWLVFRATRPPKETPTTRWIKSVQQRKK